MLICSSMISECRQSFSTLFTFQNKIYAHEVWWYGLLGFRNVADLFPHYSHLKFNYCRQTSRHEKQLCVQALCWYASRITECRMFLFTMFTFENSWNTILVSKSLRHEKELCIHEVCWYVLLGCWNLGDSFQHCPHLTFL